MIGTPPNAIVFGSGHVTLPQMAKAGMWLDVLLATPIITGLVLLLGRFTRLPSERNPPPQNQITHPYFYDTGVGHF